ncbi:hypothetical protein, partial [Methylomagnum sp.]
MNTAKAPYLGKAQYYVLALGLVITVLVYYSGLSGDFQFDDTLNILQNNRVAITQLDIEHIRNVLLSGFSGPLGRPVAMLSFAINYYFAGLNPFYFKLTNLVIHLFNGLGIFFLTRSLLQAYQTHRLPELSQSHIQWLSLILCMAWLLHPLNLTSVLYVVQRMTSLATLFTLGGLIFYIRGRQRLFDGKAGIAQIVVGLLIFMPLSLLSKEIGALLPLFLFAIEWVLFDFKAADSFSRRFLFCLFGITVAIPALGFLMLVITQPEWVTGGYLIRDFTLPERLMTEARIIWFYLWMIVFPNNSKLGMYHDDISISQGFFEPHSTLIAVVGVASLLAIAFIARKRAPILSLGLLLFLVGHSLESSIFPLELAHEHRNYFPIYGILLIIFYYLLHPLLLTESFRLRYVLAVLFISLLGLTTAVRASYWGNWMEHGLIEAAHHPDSSRANYEAGRTVWVLMMANEDTAKEKYYEQAHYYFERSAMLQKSSITGLSAIIRLDFAMGKPLNLDVLASLRQRLERGPFAPDGASMLISLSECRMDGQCRFSPSEIESIFQSAFRNPTLSGQAAAAIY